MSFDQIKALLDIGLGALSLALWFKQTKINKSFVDADTKHSATAADLTVLVKEHDARIRRLEEVDMLASATHKSRTGRKKR